MANLMSSLTAATLLFFRHRFLGAWIGITNPIGTINR
jgi:hypothetical protein